MHGLTARDDDPNKIHEKIVCPEIISLWPTVFHTFEVEIKHACSVVEYIAIYLTEGNQCL